jgi:putative MATE family efflux protein
VADEDSRIDMTTGAITPKLFHLAWPLVLGNLLQTVYNLADMFWVGRVSSEAVAAVSLMFPLTWLFVSTAIGLTSANIALVSQHIGAGNDRTADEVVAQTALLATVVSTVIASLGFLFRRPLLRWIGAGQDPLVFADALAYIEVIFLTLPLTFLFIQFRASLQGVGDTRTAMWLVAASAGVNVVLDPFLILGWGPFPAWGTRGAAWATFVSRALAAAIGMYILLRGSWGIQLHPRDLRPNPGLLRKLIDVGYPATLDGWARSFAAVAMASLVAFFGPAATAAYGIGVRMMSVSWAAAGAVGQATATGVGQNLGSETPDRAATVTYTATGATMGFLFAVGALAWIFPAGAMRVFVADSAVIDEGVRFLRIVALSWGFFGGLMVIQGGFRGAGDTRIAMVLSLLSRWGFRIPLAAALAFAWTVTVPGVGVTVAALDWGVEGLWWAYAVGAVLSFALGVVWFLRGTWREGVIERDADGPGAPEVDGESPVSDRDSGVDASPDRPGDDD